MKFTKIKQSEDTDNISIMWSNADNAYKYSEGRTVGIITIEDYEQSLDLIANGPSTEILAQLKLNNIPKDMISCRTYQVQNHRYTPGDFYDVEVVDETIVNELPYGVFNMAYNGRHETLFRPFKMEKENLKLVKNKTLKEDIVNFFTNKTDTGRKNKMGMLLYGPPGNGKTTEVMSLFDVCEELKLRIFIIDSEFTIGSMRAAQQVLNGQNTIFVLEEITERLSKRGVEEILTFLDGENSWSNSVNIATTNYPDQMPANLVDRPGRFENFIEYSNPSRNEIIELAKAFGFYYTTPEGMTVPKEMVLDDSLFGQGLSFDYVSFILSQSIKLGLPVKETRDKEEQKRKRLSETFKGRIGF
jgi:hypothetical protein